MGGRDKPGDDGRGGMYAFTFCSVFQDCGGKLRDVSRPDDDDAPWVPPRERAVPSMDHAGGWKPSQYRRRIGEVICARIEAGETVKQVAADPAMPAYCTIFQWRKMNPDFAAMYDAMRARLAQGRIEAADLAARSKVYWRIHKARVDGRGRGTGSRGRRAPIGGPGRGPIATGSRRARAG
jgi:hypothetical protein